MDLYRFLGCDEYQEKMETMYRRRSLDLHPDRVAHGVITIEEVLVWENIINVSKYTIFSKVYSCENQSDEFRHTLVIFKRGERTKALNAAKEILLNIRKRRAYDTTRLDYCSIIYTQNKQGTHYGSQSGQHRFIYFIEKGKVDII